jgi:hypothetical protein
MALRQLGTVPKAMGIPPPLNLLTFLQLLAALCPYKPRPSPATTKANQFQYAEPTPQYICLPPSAGLPYHAQLAACAIKIDPTTCDNFVIANAISANIPAPRDARSQGGTLVTCSQEHKWALLRSVGTQNIWSWQAGTKR